MQTLIVGLGLESVSGLGLEDLWEGGLMLPSSFSLKTRHLLDDAPTQTGFNFIFPLIWLLKHLWAYPS